MQARSALDALRAARPAISSLDEARHPEENAADLIEAWTAVEGSLRALVGGSALSGQMLIRAARHRNLISIDTAHALMDFLAARQRLDRTDYRPAQSDLTAATKGYESLEGALASAPREPAAAEPAETSPAPAAIPPVPTVPSQASRGQPWGLLLGILIVLVLAVGAAAFFLAPAAGSGLAILTELAPPFRPRIPIEIRRGQEAYAAGQRQQAREEFALAVQNHPELALPHIYLARLAREEGDLATAGRELAAAVQLEPNSALAQRELGSYFLARGEYDAARRAYVRALGINPADSTARGYLGCALIRLGRVEEGRRWLQRAGPGSWTACAAAAASAATPSRPPP